MNKRKTISIYTNIAYPVAGWFMGWFLFIPMLIMGVASWLFHWHEHKQGTLDGRWGESIGYLFQRMDVAAIYLTLNAFFIYALSLLIELPAGFSYLYLIPVSIFMGYFEFNDKLEKEFLVPFLFTLASFISYLAGASLWYLIPFVAAGAIGHVLYTEEDLPHGVWHLLTAWGFYLWYSALQLLL